MTSSPSGPAQRPAPKAGPTSLGLAGVDAETTGFDQTSHHAAP